MHWGLLQRGVVMYTRCMKVIKILWRIVAQSDRTGRVVSYLTSPMTLVYTAPQNVSHFHAPPSTVGTGVIGPHASRPEFPLWIKGGKTHRKNCLSPPRKIKFTPDLTGRGNSNGYRGD